MAKRKRTSTKKKKPAKKKNTKRPARRLVVYTLFAVVGLVSFFYVWSTFGDGKKGFLDSISRFITETIDTVRDTTTEQKRWQAKLYFGDEESRSLVPEKRIVSSGTSAESRAAELMRQLCSGPKNRGIRTIPEEATLHEVIMRDDGVMAIDFSNELTDEHPGGSSSELMTVFSIVNTVVLNIDEVKKVKILIDGKATDTIAGHIDCRTAFSQNPRVIKNESR